MSNTLLAQSVNNDIDYGTMVGWGTVDIKTHILNITNVVMSLILIVGLIVTLIGLIKVLRAWAHKDTAAIAKSGFTLFIGLIPIVIVIILYSVAANVVRSY